MRETLGTGSIGVLAVIASPSANAKGKPLNRLKAMTKTKGLLLIIQTSKNHTNYFYNIRELEFNSNMMEL
jgi:hypothetical protein